MFATSKSRLKMMCTGGKLVVVVKEDLCEDEVEMLEMMLRYVVVGCLHMKDMPVLDAIWGKGEIGD